MRLKNTGPAVEIDQVVYEHLATIDVADGSQLEAQGWKPVEKATPKKSTPKKAQAATKEKDA